MEFFILNIVSDQEIVSYFIKIKENIHSLMFAIMKIKLILWRLFFLTHSIDIL